MEKFVEKLLDRLKEHHNEVRDMYLKGQGNFALLDGKMRGIEDANAIIIHLAKEYKVGWIPCSEDKPNKNGWYECWYMTSAVGENKYYEPITLYWEDNIWLYRPNKFTMPTQSNVVAWKPIAPYQPKGE